LIGIAIEKKVTEYFKEFLIEQENFPDAFVLMGILPGTLCLVFEVRNHPDDFFTCQLIWSIYTLFLQGFS